MCSRWAQRHCSVAFAGSLDQGPALRCQTEPNIFDLLAFVTEPVEAFKACQSRVEAVERALKEALQARGAQRPQAGATGQDTPTSVRPGNPPADYRSS